jgi:hypothetical protein
MVYPSNVSLKKVATFNYLGSQTGQEVIFDLFFHVKDYFVSDMSYIKSDNLMVFYF